jgi:hypothetical protein
VDVILHTNESAIPMSFSEVTKRAISTFDSPFVEGFRFIIENLGC